MEFALIAPVFLLMTLFMIDAGRAIYVQSSLLNSSHQAAQALAIGASIQDAVNIANESAQGALAIAASGQSQISTQFLECPEPYDPAALESAVFSSTIAFNFFTPIALIQQFDPGNQRPGEIDITQEARWLCAG